MLDSSCCHQSPEIIDRLEVCQKLRHPDVEAGGTAVLVRVAARRVTKVDGVALWISPAP